MHDKTHTFDNGLKVYDHHLLDRQRERYRQRNVHEEDEEHIFLQLLNRVAHGGRFVSVGTAIGYYAILAKIKRPDLSIWCFEPLPLHLTYLRENITLNGLAEHDFNIQPLAVSDARGPVLFNDNRFGSAVADPSAKPPARTMFSRLFNRITESKTPEETTPQIRVEAVTLLDACRLIGDRIDLLQMDIQRHEQQVLAKFFTELDGTPSPIDCFLIGTHREPLHLGCKSLLQRHGYRIEHDEFETKHQPDGILTARR